jgi:ABC-2 type transport system permease protein
MSHYIAFLKKELVESIRTYKTLVMLAVFLIFGITNPLVAKLIPEILAAVMTDDMVFTIPEPTAFDSWVQFFSNSQTCLIVMVIVFSGILSTEFSKGTLINMLTKGLSRWAVIIAKYTSMTLVWTASLILSFLATWGYTIYLFPGDEVPNLFSAVFCLLLFGMFLLALLLFAAVISSKSYICMLITGAVIIVSVFFSIIPDAYKYNPTALAGKNMDLVTNAIELSSLSGVICISAMLSIILLAFSVVVFRKKQL